MTRREGFKKDGKYYVYCDDHYEEVNEAVYRVFMDEVWREEKRMQRSWRCRDGKGFRCNGECEQCELYRLGKGPTGSDASLDQMYEESDYEPQGSEGFEESVILNIAVEAAVDELKPKYPYVERIVRMLQNDELLKDVAKELGIPWTTLQYQEKQVKKRLQEYLRDFR